MFIMPPYAALHKAYRLFIDEHMIATSQQLLMFQIRDPDMRHP